MNQYRDIRYNTIYRAIAICMVIIIIIIDFYYHYYCIMLFNTF